MTNIECICITTWHSK